MAAIRARHLIALAGVSAAAVAWRNRTSTDLTGNVALVTGGSRGLGFLLARRLLAEGCSVAICARDQEALTRAERRLAEHGRVAAFPCNVADPEQVAQLVHAVVQRFGTIDVLVNNASIIQVGPLDALDASDFERAMDTNFWGTLNTTLAVLPIMRARGRGSIANITSIGGVVAVPHLLPYDCAKFAAIGFSKGLRAELSGEGIAVTTVVPGLMRTGSPLHVPYKGDAAAEFQWFAAGDLLPIASISAERAAARIVLAIRRGEAEVTISMPARLLRMAHALAPATVTRVLGLVNRVLPAGDSSTEVRGTRLRGRLPTRWLRRRLRRFGRASNQLPAYELLT